MSLVPTLELHNEHHHAQDTDASMRIAFNKDGCCTKHPDVLLRQKKLLGGWKVLLAECPRCSEEWRAAREASQSRVQASDTTIRQLKEEEKTHAADYEKQMKNVLSDKDGQIAVLLHRVGELQQENASLLNEVERLRQEIDVSARANAEKVQALMDAKAQLLKESEAVADEYVSSFKLSFADLSSHIQKMSMSLEMLQVQVQPPQPPATPKADGPFISALMKSDPLLSTDIQQCHADLAAAHEQLLDVIDRSEKTQALVLAEEAALRLDLSKVLSASDVDVRMDAIRREIEDTKSVSNEHMSKFKDALLNAGAESDAIAEQKRRIKDLQKQLHLLHKRYTFAFASPDDVFSRSRLDLCHLREIGFTAEDCKISGFALENIRKAGYTLKEVKAAAYTVSEARGAGYAVFDNESLKVAVRLWSTDQLSAEDRYGPISGWGVSYVTSMKELFRDTTFNDDISKWDVSNVEDMSYMFCKASSFNQPLSQWNVSQVTNMSFMFNGASSFNQPLSQWNVSQVTDMSWMFDGALSFNQPLSQWNVSQVTDMSKMFDGVSSFNQPLSQWNVSQVTNMSWMFQGASSFNQPLSQWNVSQVTNMSSMFSGASSFNQPLSEWNVSQVTNMSHMFCEASLFNQPLSQWNVSQVTNMACMFQGASSFNQPLSEWNVSQVTNMSSMLWGASSFNQPLSQWNVSQVTNMSQMFWGASSFNQPLSQWNVSQVTNMSHMFYGASLFNQSLSQWNVSQVTDMPYMFSEASSFNQPLSEWNVSQVTNMSSMFSGASSFNQPGPQKTQR